MAHVSPCVWDISSSPYDSPFLTGTRLFGENKPVHLVDQFRGKRPSLFNKEFQQNGTLELKFYPTVVLDSNVADALDLFVRHGSSNRSITEFLKFLVTQNWDISLLFYLLEHYTKSTASDFMPNAIRRSESLLRIFCIEERYFLTSGQFRISKTKQAEYLESNSKRTLGDIANTAVEEFVLNYGDSKIRTAIDATKISLIKMFFIRRYEYPKLSPCEQYNKLKEFMRDCIGIVLARELLFGYHYFNDRAGKMFGIMPNTSAAKATKILNSTAWDLWLLRIPEILLGHDPSDVCVAYVATQEKQLGVFSELQNVEKIIIDPNGRCLPQVSYPSMSIPVEIREDLLTELNSAAIKSQSGVITIQVGLLESMERELQRHSVQLETSEV